MYELFLVFKFLKWINKQTNNVRFPNPQVVLQLVFDYILIRLRTWVSITFYFLWLTHPSSSEITPSIINVSVVLDNWLGIIFLLLIVSTLIVQHRSFLLTKTHPHILLCACLRLDDPTLSKGKGLAMNWLIN